MKRRSNELELVRGIVSKGSPTEQFQYEINALTKVEREDVLERAMDDAPSIVIPADQVLAMKADLSITWNKLRVIRRYIEHSIEVHYAHCVVYT